MTRPARARALLAQLPTRWDRVAGRHVRSLHAGPSDGPDLVVVPGLGALGYLAPTVAACAAWARVRLLDVPGFGSSVTAQRPAALADVAELVTAWLRQVPDRPVLLFGHSTGAQAALHAAVAVPDQVRALALAGVTFAPSARSPAGFVRALVRTARAEPVGLVPAVLPEYVRGAVRVPQLLLSGLRDRPEDVVGQWRRPLLVLRGEHDEGCTAPWAAALAAAVPAGRVLTLPGAHNVPYTSPDLVSAALRTLVD